MKGCLIVIDMLRDFIEEDGVLYCGPASRVVIPHVADRVKTYRDKGWPVIFACDAHDEKDREFEMFPPHAVRGSRGSEIIPEIDVAPGDHVVSKTRFSAFHETALADILRTEGVTEVEVAGVCTSICVMFTAEDLRNRDYPVTVRRDCVADFS